MDPTDNEPETVDRNPVRMTVEEISECAEGMLSGRLFTNFHIPREEQAQMIPMVFMPLGLGALSGYDVGRIGAIVEWLDKAGPQSVNGYPIFSSCRLVDIDDWKRILDLYRRLKEAVDAVPRDV